MFHCRVFISYTKGVEAGDYGLALNASDQISRAPILQVGGKKYSQEPFTYPKLYYIKLWIYKNAATFFHTVGSTDYLA